jgi:hypothetical protein
VEVACGAEAAGPERVPSVAGGVGVTVVPLPSLAPDPVPAFADGLVGSAAEFGAEGDDGVTWYVKINRR